LSSKDLKEQAQAAIAAQKQVEDNSDSKVKEEEKEEKSLVEQSAEIDKIKKQLKETEK
jgi:hypothetical protein